MQSLKHLKRYAISITLLTAILGVPTAQAATLTCIYKKETAPYNAKGELLQDLKITEARKKISKGGTNYTAVAAQRLMWAWQDNQIQGMKGQAEKLLTQPGVKEVRITLSLEGTGCKGNPRPPGITIELGLAPKALD